MDIEKILKEALESRLEEHVLLFRELFFALEPEFQERELSRLNAKANGFKTVIAEPVDDENRAYRFITMEECLRWIRKNINQNASSSNIYKVLNGERKAAYGFKFRREEE